MIIIACLDDNMGMLFNGRRQSRDRAVVEDMITVSKGKVLYMKEYSYKLFLDMEADNVVVISDFPQQAKKGEYCFVEDCSLAVHNEKIEKLILYRWNRKYPADFYFDIALNKGWHLTETEDLMGTSHEKITKEIYLNEKTI